MLNKSEDLYKRNYECLTKDELFGYIRFEVPDEDKNRIERHLIECDNCFNAYQGIVSSGNIEKAETDLNSINREISIRTGSTYVRKSNYRLYLTAAAVFIIGFFSYLLLNPRDKGDVLFEKLFEPYPNVFPVFRGEEFDNSMNAAFQKYDKGDYREAKDLFERIVTLNQDDSRLLFYYGICCLTLDEPAKALSSFNKMNSGEKDLLKEQSEYYKGLAYIRLNDFSKAKKVFQLLVDGNGTYKDKAIRVLKDME